MCTLEVKEFHSLKKDEIFVFGSNLHGFHISRAAKAALQWGAKERVGFGLEGQTFAIPTIGVDYSEIKTAIKLFCEFTKILA